MFYALLGKIIRVLPARYLAKFARLLTEMALVSSFSSRTHKELSQYVWGLEFPSPFILSFPETLNEQGMIEIDHIGFGAIELEKITRTYPVNNPVAVYMNMAKQFSFEQFFTENAPYVDMIFVDVRSIQDEKMLKEVLSDVCVKRRDVLKKAHVSRNLPALIPIIESDKDTDLFEKISACLYASVDGVMLHGVDQSIESLSEQVSIAYKFMGGQVPVLVRRDVKTGDELSVLTQAGACLVVGSPSFFPEKIDGLDRILLDFLDDMHNNDKHNITEVIGNSFEIKEAQTEKEVPEKMVV